MSKKTVIAITILMIISIIFYINSSKFTTKAIFSPYEPNDCSHPSLRAVWDSVYKESSQLSEISTLNSCTLYRVRKNTTISKNYLIGMQYPSFSPNENILMAVSGNLTQEYRNTLNNPADYSASTIDINTSNVAFYAFPKNISLSEADANFKATFKATPGTWMTNATEKYTLYYYEEKESSTTENKSIFGIVLANYSLYYIIYTKKVYSCTNAWEPVNTSCRTDETLITWYNATKSCAIESTRPQNITFRCDYDNNGFIGTNNSIQLSNINIKIYSDSSLVNFSRQVNSWCNGADIDKDGDVDLTDQGILSGNYNREDCSASNNWCNGADIDKDGDVDLTDVGILSGYYGRTDCRVSNGTKTIEFKEGNISRIKLTHNFSTPLDLSAITIKKQPSSLSYGYLIVNGLNSSKTLEVDKLISSSNSVCIKDEHIDDISDINSDCSDSSEIELECPGNSGRFSCSISSNRFLVSGLLKSAVRELSPSVSCTPNWNCTAWTQCTNNQRTRICRDISACNTTISRPMLAENCSSQTTCVPDWICTDFLPAECPKNKTQTRNCIDDNKCNITTGKPSLSQLCEYKKSGKQILAIIIAVLSILAAIIVVILYFVMKNSAREERPSYIYNPPNIRFSSS